ncbi:glycosyltransferase family 2 protein [Nitrospira moscoviensis]|uniref:glycosyltransferase family 2 protein n=1 Tax=Nitrospira moscoviensis TaxID=42253 RepID=UPI0006A7746F|nr:glycosyltransferase [Nitrospira moscoviensis]
MFASICILSYNRPELLLRLLKTIDTVRVDEIEVVICEDCSPRQKEIRNVVTEFKDHHPYPVRYFENEKNIGYDGTFCELARRATGTWLIYMGDDDEFVAGALDQVLRFLHEQPQLGYVMKSHNLIHGGGAIERFRYFNETKFFAPGVETYIELFRKSVYIAGFMVRRECAVPYLTDRFNGTMLSQLYVLAEVVLRYPSAYLDKPFTQQYASHDHNVGDVMFDREKGQFIPRRPTLQISLNFLKSFSRITEFVDREHGIASTDRIKKDMSKYFYPSLAVHREAGVRIFLRYVGELNKLGFNSSYLYYIYVVLLVVLGKGVCDWGIFQIKRILGRTPRL